MSSGRVFHVGCLGELVYYWPRGYTCEMCGALWDGRQHGIAEYRETEKKEVDQDAGSRRDS